MASNDDNILLHIILIGFNHRKGGIVEFSYPPLDGNKEESESIACPESWKYLPQLTLPDGSHNFQNDTVFFALPSIKQPNQSVYGISCFRQILVEDLKIRTSDVTRSSVTKAICALLKIPIYGYIEVKLSLLARAFFDQGDFSKTDVLITAYEQLTCCLKEFPLSYDTKYLSSNNSAISHMHVGLNLRDLVTKWKSKLLTLFKLSLLEKRVIYFGSPVRPISSLILAVNSLHPLLIEAGFKEVAYVKPSRSMSPIPEYEVEIVIKEKSECELIYDNSCIDREVNDTSEFEDKKTPESDEILEKNQLSKDNNPAANIVDTFVKNMETYCSIKPNDWIGPMPIYKNGYLCLPFISLSYMDLICDRSVIAYVIGASNVLFRQKKNLADVLVDVQNTNIETANESLKKIIQPSTEDLRFMDYVLKNVQNPKENGDGNENWIRRQFNGYFVSMLRTMYENNNDETSRDYEYFNGPFMLTWQKTNNYQEWLTKMITSKAKSPDKTTKFDELNPGHPFSGQTMTVQDMKLRIVQTMHSTESGRKINQAYSTAKTTISTWFSSFAPTQIPDVEKQEKGMKMDDKKESKSKTTSKKITEPEEVDTEVAERAV